MKIEMIAAFMKALGISEPQQTGMWMMGSCPLAPFRHSKGTDSRASFGINVESTKYNCFTCDSGTLEKLIQQLEMYTEQEPKFAPAYDFVQARDILQGIEDYIEPLPEFQEIVPVGLPFKAWPDYMLDSFIPWDHSPRAKWYLEFGRKEVDKRNQSIDPAVATMLRMMYDPANDRLVTPFWTWTGKLAGARGRAIDCHATLKHYDYSWGKVNNSHAVWYNEQALDLSVLHHRPLVIVEGQFDCANVARVYPYVVAGLTAKSSLEKVKKLENVETVVTLLDNDPPGREAADRYAKFLRGKVRFGNMKFPEEWKDPGQLPKEVLEELFNEFLS